MKNLIGILCLLLLPLSAIQSQEPASNHEIFDDAEFFFSTEEYEVALYLFLQLHNKLPDHFNLNFRIGMSYLNIPGQETKAIPYFEKAVEKTSLKYKPRNFDIIEAPHHTWFYLGNAYRINNDLDEALECYEKFQDIRNFEKKYNLRMVENEVIASERAKIIKDNPVNLVKIHLGETINSGVKTYQPVVNRQETVIAFMQEQKFYDAIMFSRKVDGEWQTPQNITPQVGSDGDMLPSGFSDDGETLFLIKRTNSSNGDIYVSYKEGELWTQAEKLPEGFNSRKDEAHVSVSADGKTMLISSSRRGGMGGLDIYILTKDENDEWSQPENLGSFINTDRDETSPFLMNDGNTLYFTSKGHFNMGGFDIFISEKNDKGEWSNPVNIGFPLNTTGDNRFFQPVQDGKSGYIALFGEESNLGEEDIYRVEIMSFTDPLVPANAMFNQGFTLFLENEETGEIIEIVYDRKSDTISTNSNQEKKYKWKLKKQ